MFTLSELQIIEDIVGGRYDALKEMVDQFPDMPNKDQLLDDIKTLEPIVKKLRDEK